MSRYYRVLCDGREMYNVDKRNKILINPVVKPSLEGAGSFDFTIDKSHRYYDTIIPYGSNIEVLEDGQTIFFGRPLPPTTNIFNQKIYHCEGAISFLNDVICKPLSKYIYTVFEGGESTTPFVDGSDSGTFTGEGEDDGEKQRRTIKLSEYIEYVFSQYNSHQTRNDRKLYLRNYSPEHDATIVYDSDYKTCLEVLRSEILPKTGGYLVATKDPETGHILVDITNNFGSSNQTIRSGRNLIDFTSVQQPFYTAIMAKGGNPNNDFSRDVEPIVLDEPMTLSSTLVYKYGFLCAYKEFPECTTQSALEARCRDFLDSQQFDSYNFDVTATDLHIVKDSYDILRVGNRVMFTSPSHDIHKVSLLITGMEIRLDTGEKKISIGSRERRDLTHNVSWVTIKQENNVTNEADITVDDTVTQGSSNPVSSGAVYDALQGGGGGGGGDGWIHQINGMTQETGTINFTYEE